jgi:hypothetical protein
MPLPRKGASAAGDVRFRVAVIVPAGVGTAEGYCYTWTLVVGV